MTKRIDPTIAAALDELCAGHPVVELRVSDRERRLNARGYLYWTVGRPTLLARPDTLCLVGFDGVVELVAGAPL